MTDPVFLLLDTALITDAAHLGQQLSNSSQNRLAQLRTETRARQFILGRWLMAAAATRLLDRPLALEAIDDHGPFPVFANQADLHASISHSANLLGVVVSKGTRIGLDIENASRTRDYLALAKRAFHADEVAQLSPLSGEALASAFYRIWTWREAAYKAGLSEQVVGGEALTRYDLQAQSGKIDDFFWTAVSSQAFVIRPQKLTTQPV